MNNISFVLWVLLWPLIFRVGAHLSFLMGRSLEDVTMTDSGAMFITLVLIALVVLLYRKD